MGSTRESEKTKHQIQHEPVNRGYLTERQKQSQVKYNDKIKMQEEQIKFSQQRKEDSDDSQFSDVESNEDDAIAVQVDEDVNVLTANVNLTREEKAR